MAAKDRTLLPHRRPQDQQRARPGPHGAPTRQAANRRRDRRGPARRGGGHRLRPLRARLRRLHGLRGHGAPGAELERMRLLGAEVSPVESGTRTPEGGDERGDPGLDHERRDDPLHDRLLRGPHRIRSSSGELQAVIGREARAQILATEGRAPTRSSPAWAEARTPSASSPASWTTPTAPDRSEAAGAASLGTGRAGVLHGARSPSSPTRTGRSPMRIRSRPGSTTRASAPSTPSSGTPAAPNTCQQPMRRRSPRSTSSPSGRGS